MNYQKLLNDISIFETFSSDPDTVQSLCEGVNNELKTFNSVDELMEYLNEDNINQQ